MTLEELYQKYAKHRAETSSAFAAVKVMIDGLTGRAAALQGDSAKL